MFVRIETQCEGKCGEFYCSRRWNINLPLHIKVLIRNNSSQHLENVSH